MIYTTNPRVVIKRRLVDGKFVEDLDEQATKERRTRKPLTDKEVQAILKNADEKISKEYFRLRIKAVVSIANIYGKRRSEIASLEVNDLEIDDSGYLLVTFTLRKKHKFGLHQYLKFLEKTNAEILKVKTIQQLKTDWKQWQKTEMGYKLKERKVTKKVSIKEPYVSNILAYLDYVKTHFPKAKFLFPLGKAVFDEYIIYNDQHIDARTFLNTLKEIAPDAWMHLFREKKGGGVAKACGMNLESVFKVKTTLDLESEQTAFNYVRRFAIEEIKAEET